MKSVKKSVDTPVALATHNTHLHGGFAFVTAFVVAVIVGMFGSFNESMVVLLMTIGFLVGIINITHDETTPFLVSGVALILISNFGQDVLVYVPQVNSILFAINAIFVPATLFVAIKNVFVIAERE